MRHQAALSSLLGSCFCFTTAWALLPSVRIVYYLHTTPAPWAAARDTCARYGGQLVKNSPTLEADVDILDTWLDWQGAYQSLQSDVWSGLHKVTDPVSNTDQVQWQNCQVVPKEEDIVRQLQASSSYCASMNRSFQLQTRPCDVRLPYICQVEEGQCWFLPLENKQLTSPNPLNMSGDLNTCAKNCRNEGNTSECWGFVAQSGRCLLYTHESRQIFLRQPGQFLKVDQLSNVTSYLKICTGGETTDMNPVTTDSSVRPAYVNCSSQIDTTETWNQGVCYCDCDQPPVILDPAYLVLPIDEKIDKLVRELHVDAKNTSASYRKLNSAEDDRPSAQSIGAVGIIVLALVFGGLVLLDLDVLVSHIHRLLCRRAASRRTTDQM